MDSYLEGIKNYYSMGYEAENVESFVFRPYGSVFKYEFGLGGKNEKMLDFGCGQGAALAFFKRKGFNVYGVDVSKPDIEVCKMRMVDIPTHFTDVDPKPNANDIFFGGEFDLITAIQSLYHYSNTDMETRLQSLYNMMKPGAIIYATMMTKKHWYYECSKEYKDGLREVTIKSDRLNISDYFVNFVETQEEVVEKFHLFEKKHLGYYSHKFREDEGDREHFTFIGVKK